MEKKEVNKFAAIEFRTFCINNGLNFHFPDEAINSNVDPLVLQREYPLICKALDLFNRSSPYLLDQNNVINFQFASIMPGDISYTTYSVKDLIRDRDFLRVEVSGLKRNFEIIIAICGILLIVVFLLIMNRLAIHMNQGGYVSFMFSILSFMLPISIVVGVVFYVKHVEKLSEQQEKLKEIRIDGSIMELRERLAEANISAHIGT